ncbi:MAG: hypothetical protein LBC38_01335 [Oscillospiraceae bacterium]|jgi:rod shape-determining protein MreD|nr:hypothetical protein [Oscillospiraceae bacterium]
MLSLTKVKAIRAIRRVAVLLILFFLQSMLARARILGAAPLLLPAGAVGLALFCENEWGGLWGLIAGVLCDVGVGDSALLCTIVLTIAGFGTGFLTEFFFTKSFVTYLIIAAAALALLCICQFIPPVLLREVPVELSVAVPVLLVQYLYSALFVIPTYFLSKFLGGT